MLVLQLAFGRDNRGDIDVYSCCAAGIGTAFTLYLSAAITSYMALGDNIPGDVATGFSSAPAWLTILLNVMVLLRMVAAVQVCSLNLSFIT